MATTVVAQSRKAGATQPNDLDLRRIERAIEERKRYRYVTARVHAVRGGYRIEAPCCSRTVDPDGGLVDIAFLEFDEEAGLWRLFSRNHEEQRWDLSMIYERLRDLLDTLNNDPDRKFWQ